jgi:hypothetical protein
MLKVAGFHQHAHSVVLAADKSVRSHVGAMLLRGERRHVSPAGADLDQLVTGNRVRSMAY